MYGKIDVEDALLGVIFTSAALTSAGIGTISILGYGLANPIVDVLGRGITLSFVLAIVSLAGAYVTNRANKSPQKSYEIDTDLKNIAFGAATIETYLALGTVAVVAIMGLNILGIADLVQSAWYIGLPVVALEAGGYYVVSYLG